MKIIIGFFVFCIVLFIYLHVQFHLKTSDDLEMYEVDQPSKDRLEEICDIRQPVLFDFECSKIIESTNKNFVTNNYTAFEVKIRNIREKDPDAELYVPLPIHAATKLFEEDKTASYFTENNTDFLEETGVVKNFSYNDEFLRPYMVSNCNYDLLIGSHNCCTPFRYEINYRNYLLLTQGSAQIKMAPPYSKKYLYPIYDYENFEFKSPVNPWAPQTQYAADFDKIKCLEFTLTPGKTLYIPAYWWYSIRFNDSDTSISCFQYRTYMNNIAISPYVFLHALQIQNVKRNVAKKLDIKKLNDQPLTSIVETQKENQNTSITENLTENLTEGSSIDSLPQPDSNNNNIGTEI